MLLPINTFLEQGKNPYKVQTFDGKIHPAKVIPTQVSSRYDIALLEFPANGENYQTVIMGKSSDLKVGEPVFAVGFPYQYQENNSAAPKELTNNNMQKDLAFTKGRVSVILDQALEEGYQIGYTNEVHKGMSGGALLTIDGFLVGVNGKHAYPLWEAPDFFEDQSQPCPPLQELIIRSSLAIPVEKIINATPEVSWPSLLDIRIASDDQTWLSIPIDPKEKNSQELKKSIATMQAEAVSSKNCQESNLPNQ